MECHHFDIVFHILRQAIKNNLLYILILCRFSYYKNTHLQTVDNFIFVPILPPMEIPVGLAGHHYCVSVDFNL